MGDVLQQIGLVAEELCDPRQHTERVEYWDHNRHRKFRAHTTVQPGLLAQLHASVEPGSADREGGAPHPSSRPPVQTEALSRYASIGIAVTRWCWSLRLEQRDTVESTVRALVGAAGVLDDDTARALLSEMRQWRRWCVVLTGWEQVYVPRAACPVCETVGTLRINLTTREAFCTSCAAGWDEDAIGVLAEHIKTTTEGQAA